MDIIEIATNQVAHSRDKQTLGIHHDEHFKSQIIRKKYTCTFKKLVVHLIMEFVSKSLL